MIIRIKNIDIRSYYIGYAFGIAETLLGEFLAFEIIKLIKNAN